MKEMIVATGSFLIPEFSAVGGISYARTDGQTTTDGDTEEAEFTTRRVVDHVGLVKMSKQLVSRAYNVMERHAANTPLGYFASPDAAEKIAEEIAPLAEAADEFNAEARAMGSARRIRIAYYPVRVLEDDHGAALRLAALVHERLTEAAAALRAEDKAAWVAIWPKIRHLPRLATGIQADAVSLAVEAAKEIRDAWGADDPMVPQYYGAIEAAISMFSTLDGEGLL